MVNGNWVMRGVGPPEPEHSGPVFRTVFQVLLLGSVAVSGGLAAVRLWDKLNRQRDAEQHSDHARRHHGHGR